MRVDMAIFLRAATSSETWRAITQQALDAYAAYIRAALPAIVRAALTNQAVAQAVADALGY